MNWPMLYLVCFLVGLVLSVLAFAGGAGHLHLGHFHLGHWHFGHAHAGHGGDGHGGMPAVNGFTVTVFLCWFGGIGYLLTQRHAYGASLVLLLALGTGLLGASVISLFLTRVLLPHERALEPADTEMRGVVARVSSTLRPGGTGEILFSLNGTRRCAAARAENGGAIDRDVEVVVMRYSRGIAWVRPFCELETVEQAGVPPADVAGEMASGSPT